MKTVFLVEKRGNPPCPTKRKVHIPNGEDVVVPWRESNHVAVDLITQHIRSKLGAWLWLVMAFGE